MDKRDVGILITTGLSIYTLRKKTVIESSNPLVEPNQFTPAGRKYLKLLIVSTLLTIGVSILQNWSDDRLQKDAQTKLLDAMVRDLNGQTDDLLNKFDKKLNDETTSLKQNFDGLDHAISSTRDAVDHSGGHLIHLFGQANRDLSLAGREVTNFSVGVGIPSGAVHVRARIPRC